MSVDLIVGKKLRTAIKEAGAVNEAEALQKYGAHQSIPKIQ